MHRYVFTDNTSVLVWDLLEAGPQSRIQGQVIYLAMQVKKEESETRKRRTLRKGAYQGSYNCGWLGLNPSWNLGGCVEHTEDMREWDIHPRLPLFIGWEGHPSHCAPSIYLHGQSWFLHPERALGQRGASASRWNSGRYVLTGQGKDVNSIPTAFPKTAYKKFLFIRLNLFSKYVKRKK